MRVTRHLCRAKRKDNGAWVEGYYVLLHKTTIGIGEEPADNAVHQIVYEHMTDWNLPNNWFRVEVDPNTVCQCTGLRDNNGKYIYEGDIIKHFDGSELGYDIGVVRWDDSACSYHRATDTKQYTRYCGIAQGCRYEVVGNIFDNPELLEEWRNGQQ